MNFNYVLCDFVCESSQREKETVSSEVRKGKNKEDDNILEKDQQGNKLKLLKEISKSSYWQNENEC